MSADELEFRNAVSGAVRAAVAVHGGGGASSSKGLGRSSSMPGPRARRRAEAQAEAAATASAELKRKRKPAVVDDVQVWDSVSQAPSRRTVEDGEESCFTWEAKSAETMTESRVNMSLDNRLDRDIQEHHRRNRKGHYDWHGGRFFG
jgi:hypothetical protein